MSTLSISWARQRQGKAGEAGQSTDATRSVFHATSEQRAAHALKGPSLNLVPDASVDPESIATTQRFTTMAPGSCLPPTR